MDRFKKLLLLICCYSPCVISQTNFGVIYNLRSPHIVLEKQHVNINPEQVKVLYSFKNTHHQPIQETLGLSFPYYSTENFRQVTILINNQPLQYQTAYRAINSNGIDISAALKSLGVPLDPVAALNYLDRSSNRTNIIAKLQTLKAIDKDDIPAWLVKTFYFWQQEFPPQSTLTIEEHYKPINNNMQFNLYSMQSILKLPWRLLKKAVNLAINWHDNDEIATANIREYFERYVPQIKNYCANQQDFIALANAYKKNHKDAIEIREIDLAVNIDEICPVGNFILNIESPDNMHPLICWHDKLQDSKNKSLQFTAENYMPMQNIQIMYIEK